MNHFCLAACHISLVRKRVCVCYVHKACEGPHERAAIPPFILKGLFGSYDTFTYSPEQK